MKYILKLEELAMTIIAIIGIRHYNLNISLWVWVILFFMPDIGMLGYLINTKVGAVLYNLFHHKGIAIFIALIGYFIGNEIMIATGLLLFAHASFDGIWGYGLKFNDNFKHTHLGNL